MFTNEIGGKGNFGERKRGFLPPASVSSAHRASVVGGRNKLFASAVQVWLTDDASVAGRTGGSPFAWICVISPFCCIDMCGLCVLQMSFPSGLPDSADSHCQQKMPLRLFFDTKRAANLTICQIAWRWPGRSWM